MLHLSLQHCAVLRMLSAKIFDADYSERDPDLALQKSVFFLSSFASSAAICLRMSVGHPLALAIRSRLSRFNMPQMCLSDSAAYDVLLSCRDKRTLVDILKGLHPTLVKSDEELMPISTTRHQGIV